MPAALSHYGEPFDAVLLYNTQRVFCFSLKDRYLIILTFIYQKNYIFNRKTNYLLALLKSKATSTHEEVYSADSNDSGEMKWLLDVDVLVKTFKETESVGLGEHCIRPFQTASFVPLLLRGMTGQNT